MPKFHTTRWLWQLLAACSAILIYRGLQPLPSTNSAPAVSTTWYVTTSSDNVNDGNLDTHRGSLRFALKNAQSDDVVRFSLNTENVIVVGSTLTVPEGVAVGYTRDEGCGDANTPRANVKAISGIVNPVFSLSANSTLRNIDVGGGYNGIEIIGENVDVCGVGIGIQSSGETNVLPPSRAGLIVDGANAVVHRNIIYGNNTYRGDIVVDVNGSDSRIGDTLYGSGDSNEGWCSPLGLCTVKIITSSLSAAQRVTIRDAFPRFLAGMPGSGVSGGDDDPTHANNWAQTPTILIAETFDNFATIHVSGTANPLSVVDIYFDDDTAYTRQVPVTVTAAGTFDFWGTGHGPLAPIQVVAASTLNDPAHLNRVGSSSQFSGRVLVTAVNPDVLHLTPNALTFSALVGDPNPPDQPLSVIAPSITPMLAWQTSVTTTDGLNWLNVLPITGSGDGTISVTVDASGLMTGTYHGTVTVFDPAQSSDQATTDVTLNVTEPPVLDKHVWLPLIIR